MPSRDHFVSLSEYIYAMVRREGGREGAEGRGGKRMNKEKY